jgi:hypothetical protein
MHCRFGFILAFALCALVTACSGSSGDSGDIPGRGIVFSVFFETPMVLDAGGYAYWPAWK